MSRLKIAVWLGTAAGLTMLATLAAIQTGEDAELRDLDVTGWNCANKSEGTKQSLHIATDHIFGLALMAMVEELYSLFKADGDDQADDDGGYVNKKLCPTVDSVWWMNL